MVDLIERALALATKAHEGQKRKYTNEPYISHPIAVAEIVKSVPHTPAMVAAALCHDVVEDTAVTLDQIRAELGDEVADLVYWLTDKSKPGDGNRAKRKLIDRLHLEVAHPDAQTIKLADLIDNLSSIEAHDPAFAKTYREEKALLLDVMRGGDATLHARALGVVNL